MHKRERHRVKPVMIWLPLFMIMAIATSGEASAQQTYTPAQACGWSPQVQAEVNEILNPPHGLGRVRRIRADATALKSTLPEGTLELRLSYLLWFMISDYAANCTRYSIGLLSALPTGQSYQGYLTGTKNSTTSQLQGTFWLCDNECYAIPAFTEGYARAIGQRLNLDVFGEDGLWNTEPNSKTLCPQDSSMYVGGALPSWDGGTPVNDPRCNVITPANVPTDWQYFMRQGYPASLDGLPLPIIGVDSVILTSSNGVQSVATKPTLTNAPRDLLKYGCLRQVLKGNPKGAVQFFNDALNNWTGVGFPEPGARHPNPYVYWARDLAFVLACANALGPHAAEATLWTPALQSQIETQLWILQGNNGGIWDVYCAFDGKAPCNVNPSGGSTGISNVAKQTNEIAPLVLLAYGANIWKASR